MNSHKYLGVFICADGRDDIDIQRQIRGIYALGNMIINYLRHCSVEVKTMLFKTYCCNMYCSNLWTKFYAKSFNNIRWAFKRVYRYFMNLKRDSSISMSMVENRVNVFDVIVRNYICKFMLRLNHCDNLIVKTLVNSLFYSGSTVYVKWCNMIYLRSLEL